MRPMFAFGRPKRLKEQVSSFIDNIQKYNENE